MARRGVRQLLAPFADFVVVGECRNGDDVLASLDTLQPDVVFLDVQMPGVDGFEVIRRRTPERMPLVVFLTAYDEFAIRAFEAQALDYLVKPVSEARFAATMKRLREATASGGLVAARRPASSCPPRAARSSCRSTRSTGSKPPTTTRGSGSAAAATCCASRCRSWKQRVRAAGFVRAHRQALVPLNRVRQLRRTADGSLVAVLASGVEVPVSRRRRAAFAAAFKRRYRDQS